MILILLKSSSKEAIASIFSLIATDKCNASAGSSPVSLNEF